MEVLCEQLLAVPRDRVFAYFADPSHLPALYAGVPGFRLIRHGGGVLPGSETWISVSPIPGVSMVLGFRHTIWEPPDRFGEVAIRGPFARFLHVHEFEDRPGGTLVRDRVDLRLPWWAGGEISARAVAGPLLRRGFEGRQEGLRGLAARGWPEVPAAAGGAAALDGTAKLR